MRMRAPLPWMILAVVAIAVWACGGATDETGAPTPAPPSTSTTSSSGSSGTGSYPCAKGGRCEGETFETKDECIAAGHEVCEPYNVCGSPPWCGRTPCREPLSCNPGDIPVQSCGDAGAADTSDCYVRTGCDASIACEVGG